MYPQCPLPRHITALYLTTVINCFVLFHVALVGADVLVYSQLTHEQVEGVGFADIPARFGDRLPLDGLKGMVMYADPPNACVPIKRPNRSIDNFTGKWIALIKRYDCSFAEKIRNAQSSDYDAAIVHNVNSSTIETMDANGTERIGITIPSVFVGEEDGLTIRENYLYNDGFYVIINDELPFNINTHLLLPFAIVVGICFLIMVVFVIVKCIKDHRQQRRHRLPSSSLKKIPTSKYKKGDPYETCAICLEDYQEGEKLRILPCSHELVASTGNVNTKRIVKKNEIEKIYTSATTYHTKCIDPWLTRNRRVCPVCKRKVFAHDEHVSDSESDSEDEMAPLVRPSSYGTQGGTFVPQRENPFQRAQRQQETSSSASSRSGEAEGYENASYVYEREPPPLGVQKPRADQASDDTSNSDSTYGSPMSSSFSQQRRPQDGVKREDVTTASTEPVSYVTLTSSGDHSINSHADDIVVHSATQSSPVMQARDNSLGPVEIAVDVASARSPQSRIEVQENSARQNDVVV